MFFSILFFSISLIRCKIILSVSVLDSILSRFLISLLLVLNNSICSVKSDTKPTSSDKLCDSLKLVLKTESVCILFSSFDDRVEN
ncbi:hypothetical protein TRFO_26407 [Tritrichomonas foetus]|uniref:Uncharacterized protein n=1 Tax=Tritrichomonas foetus TaxID=1144522 RepID=A0A1J4K4M5_9EUKA|nr:hypothetical protein TRFO_26407 [Tritrichomonas foetus]|eukprot:OHT05800.1 hypothetical protein TRFO_26407 [Tritrichomonas foetus]